MLLALATSSSALYTGAVVAANKPVLVGRRAGPVVLTTALVLRLCILHRGSSRRLITTKGAPAAACTADKPSALWTIATNNIHFFQTGKISNQKA